MDRHVTDPNILKNSNQLYKQNDKWTCFFILISFLRLYSDILPVLLLYRLKWCYSRKIVFQIQSLLKITLGIPLLINDYRVLLCYLNINLID